MIRYIVENKEYCQITDQIKQEVKNRLLNDIKSGSIAAERLGCMSKYISIKNILIHGMTVGYNILYTGPGSLSIIRMPVLKNNEAFSININTGETIAISRVELALLGSRPEINCKFNNGKIILGCGMPSSEFYNELNRYYFAFDDESMRKKSGCEVPIEDIVSKEYIQRFFLLTLKASENSAHINQNKSSEKIKGLFGLF